MALGAAFFMGAKFIENSSFNFKHHIYPINTLYNAKFALAKLGRIDNFLTTSKGFKFGSTHAALSTDSLKREREVYVLILGETARATNWHLYGYERNTTPNVDTLTNLVKYSDVLTQSNTTHKIVPLVLSGAEAKNYEFIYKSKSVVSAFKEAGFKTIFITNQEYNLGFAKYYFNEADVKISVAKDGVNGLDHNILSYFYEELSNNREENLFFILHLYGSHFNYSERYSSAFREYLPDEVGSISGKYKTNLINSYDNSIRYTDEFIYNVIKRVERENVVSTVLYLSDHGEDLLDDKREKFLHASPLPTFYQLHIPYIVWLSNKYIDLKPNKSNSIVENRDIPISNNTVFHSLLDMASIYTPYLDLTLSIASDSLKRVGREYLTDHDDCIKIINIPFNKYDLEQFRKRSIIFE